MCDTPDYESSSVFTEERRRARKEHRCASCNATVRRGDVHVRHFSVFDGYTTTERMCIACDRTMATYAKHHDGARWAPSGLGEALDDCIENSDTPLESLNWRRRLARLNARRRAAREARGTT